MKIENRGRKKIPRNKRRSEWIGAALTVDQKTDFQTRAQSSGLSESNFLRMLCGISDGKQAVGSSEK